MSQQLTQLRGDGMDRRKFVALIGGALALPLAFAQAPGKRYRIGYLASSSPKANARPLEAFREGLRELGYVEGQNLEIEYRSTDDNVAGLPKLAAELVGLKVDVIFAWTTPVALAARKATATIPIVMVGIADPVGSGLVASLARPGGNITGMSNFSADLSGKLVELLVQVAPGIKRFAGVRNALNPASALQQNETEAAARAFGLQFQVFDVRAPDDLEAAFAGMVKARAMGAVFFADPLWLSQRQRIAELALAHRLPTVFSRQENVESGGLMAYGPNLSSQFRRAAVFVDRILKGAKPADLPVEQPTKIDLVINLKTAKALGLTIPQSVLLRVDRVIE